MRPEDEAKPEPVTPGAESGEADGIGEMETDADAGDVPVGGAVTPIRGGTETEDTAPALSATLLAELEAHRTAGLQAAIAGQPGLALRVLLHGLATDAFYNRFGDTVAAFHAYSPALASACPGIGDSPARRAMAAAEEAWRARLPNEHGVLWDWLGEPRVLLTMWPPRWRRIIPNCWPERVGVSWPATWLGMGKPTPAQGAEAARS